MTAQQHYEKAQEFKQAAKEEAVEGLQKLKDSGADAGRYMKEKAKQDVDAGKEGFQAAFDNLGKARDYFAGKAEEATGTIKANVVTATSFIKTQVEQAQENANEAFEAANSVAGEFAYQAAETAKDGASKAGDLWKSSTEAIEEKATDAQNALHNSASKVKDKGKKIKAKVGSYFSEGRESLMGQFHLVDDMGRAWKRFKSKLYTTEKAAPSGNFDRKDIQDFVNSYLNEKNIKMDPNELVSSIYETLKDSKDSIMDKIQDGTQFIQDKASETYKSAKGYSGIDYSAFTDSLNEAYESGSSSPRKIWKSVYYKLSDSDNPLANSISGMAKTPIPITSFYLSFFTFLACYAVMFSRRIGCPSVIIAPKKQGSSDQLLVQEATDSYSFYTFISDNFAWAPMAFINILVLELNGYPNIVVHSISLLILSMEGLSRFCPASNHQSIKTAIISVVMLSSALNFFTALTGFPVID